MKSVTTKIRSPLDCELSEYHHWSEKYKATSQKYSVVKLVKTIGTDFSQELVIKLHDQTCNESMQGRLA